MNKVRIGVIGLGNMGTVHVRTLLDGRVDRLAVTAVSDLNPEKKSLFPGLTFFENPLELVASGEVDAVLVATPHYSHTNLGIAVLDSGKHLLVEKPISVHKEDAEKLIAAHRDPKQVFSAMFNQRTDPRYRKLKELVSSGELGKIRRVSWTITDWFRTASYYASGGWRATWAGEGGGVLLNQSPHQLDLWQWIFGMPLRLRAFCDIGRYHEIEVEDDVTCYMEYADGCKGIFTTTTGEAPGSNRLEIAAENGRVVVDAEVPGIRWDRNEVPMSDWNRTAEGSFTKPPTWEVRIPIDGKGPQHQGILENFTRAILDGEPLIAPASEGRHSVELANAMLYSSFTGGNVEFPLDAAAYAGWLKKKIGSSTFRKREVREGLATDFDQG